MSALPHLLEITPRRGRFDREKPRGGRPQTTLHRLLPDVYLILFDFQLGFVDCTRRMVVGIQFEEVRQSAVPLAYGFHTSA